MSLRDRGGSLRHLAAFAPIWTLRTLLGWLPIDLSLRLGAGIGRLWARVGGPRTEVARINLRIAFPEWSEAERERTLRASFANLGRVAAEVSLLQGPHREALVDCARIEGLEHYEAAKAASPSGGIIVLTAHFGSWELCGAAMSRQGYPLCVIHHDFENPYVARMVASWRREAGLTALELGRAGLSVLRELARGQLVALLLDQNAGREEGVFVPFFSCPASTRSAPARLAVARQVPVLPVFFFREAEGRHHVARVYPALELSSEESEEAQLHNVELMNQAIETAIREAPDQWLWVHKRWKTRPEPEGQRIYPRRRRAGRTPEAPAEGPRSVVSSSRPDLER